MDPDLASAIYDPAQRRSALRGVTGARLDLDRGEQLDYRAVGPSARFGVLVISGFLVRELTTETGRVSADLFGPEDVIQPDGTVPEVAMLQHTVALTAITEVRVGLLDEAFFERTARWPEIAAVLFERAGRSGQRLALRGAIETLQTVDSRLLASLWTWASQWATVAGNGVVLRVPLSHERLAHLIHARRPTVTSALGRLRRSGLVSQRRDGSWLLHGPRSENGEKALGGVAMPVLDDMVERAPTLPTKTASSQADARALALRELKGRLAEQREILRAAASRHHEMLERMRRETDRLTDAGGPASESHK